MTARRSDSPEQTAIKCLRTRIQRERCDSRCGATGGWSSRADDLVASLDATPATWRIVRMVYLQATPFNWLVAVA
jgi:hypothetical protein